MSDTQANGVVMLFSDEHGRIIAHVADFDESGYGGFSLLESQRHRAKDALAWAVIDAYASPQLSRAFNERHNAREVMRRLEQQHNCTVKEIVIGHLAKSGHPDVKGKEE